MRWWKWTGCDNISKMRDRERKRWSSEPSCKAGEAIICGKWQHTVYCIINSKIFSFKKESGEKMIWSFTVETKHWVKDRCSWKECLAWLDKRDFYFSWASVVELNAAEWGTSVNDLSHQVGVHFNGHWLTSCICWMDMTHLIRALAGWSGPTVKHWTPLTNLWLQHLGFN